MSSLRWARAVCVASLALALSIASGLAAERRVALVIGNAAYRNAAVLENPVRDAKSIAEMFKVAGFDAVEIQQNLDSLELKRAIRNFMLKARDSDVAVVFFAGHGVEVNGTNYVLPTDAKLRTDFDAEDEGVALDRIIRAVEPARRLRLVILDACRDNPFINLMQRTVSMRAITAGLGKVEPEVSDTLVAYAARAGSVAEDGTSDHSPFTSALLKHLPTPGLDIRVAFGRVRDDVMRATGGKQEPFVYGSLGGSTISIVPEAVPEPVAPRDSVAEIRRDYEFAERVGTKEAWEYFLQAHPKGFFADLARAQLTKFPSATQLATLGKVDVSKPETRKPALEPPAPPPVTREPASEPAAPAAARGPCENDSAVLARLRDQQIVAEIVRFARELKCESLRPQVTRLLESTSAAGGLALAKVQPPPAVKAAIVVAPAAPRSENASPPQGRSEAGSATARLDRSSGTGCDQEALTLARLRENPDFQAVDAFARALTCPALKPQVMRLRESLQD